MDKVKLEKEIEELLKSLSTKSMSNVNQGPDMETLEKKLMSRVGVLANINLSEINKRFEDLGSAISQVNYSIQVGIGSNDLLAKETQKHNIAMNIWTGLLVVATALLVISGFWQGGLLKTYTRETQKLVKVTQEQLDLQLQPALMISADGFLGSIYKDLNLINIGNGVALNIKISSEDKDFQVVDTPDFLEAKKDSALHYTKKTVDISRIPQNELGHLITRGYSFTENKELRIHLEYENINNKKYFTDVAVSNKGAKLVKRGEIVN